MGLRAESETRQPAVTDDTLIPKVRGTPGGLISLAAIFVRHDNGTFLADKDWAFRLFAPHPISPWDSHLIECFRGVYNTDPTHKELALARLKYAHDHFSV